MTPRTGITSGLPEGRAVAFVRHALARACAAALAFNGSHERAVGDVIETGAADSQRRFTLLVLPNARRAGFHADIRGRILELADPQSEDGVTPTPDDLLVAALASLAAWTTLAALRESDQPGEATVSASWETGKEKSLDSVEVTVTVPPTVAVTARDIVRGAIEDAIRAKFRTDPRRVRLKIA